MWRRRWRSAAACAAWSSAPTASTPSALRSPSPFFLIARAGYTFGARRRQRAVAVGTLLGACFGAGLSVLGHGLAARVLTSGGVGGGGRGSAVEELGAGAGGAVREHDRRPRRHPPRARTHPQPPRFNPPNQIHFLTMSVLCVDWTGGGTHSILPRGISVCLCRRVFPVLKWRGSAWHALTIRIRNPHNTSVCKRRIGVQPRTLKLASVCAQARGWSTWG